ncbi:hypothetical protein M744_12885 [Synechococcus elongatus UTEX 2973]|uniref:hypothetical protein n=1 Tax=Synechococcus elongatus TaxID=32046 RepID=UPI0005863713|nr:hypothetical protein [Synechococcus elongatus]AJD58664.1 hypothetical protein M744_12885 [Synechococcus elongatus UTEX 2973]
MKNTFTHTAGLAQLMLMLACAVIAEYAPVAGRHLGRWAGRTIVAGRIARRWYNTHLAHRVAIAEYGFRRFVAEQLGEEAPALRAAIEPWALTVYMVQTHTAAVDANIPTVCASMTIRELNSPLSSVQRYWRSSMRCDPPNWDTKTCP